MNQQLPDIQNQQYQEFLASQVIPIEYSQILEHQNQQAKDFFTSAFSQTNNDYEISETKEEPEDSIVPQMPESLDYEIQSTLQTNNTRPTSLDDRIEEPFHSQVQPQQPEMYLANQLESRISNSYKLLSGTGSMRYHYQANSFDYRMPDLLPSKRPQNYAKYH